MPESGPAAKRAWLLFPAFGFGALTAVGALAHDSVGTAIVQGVVAGVLFGVLWVPTMLVTFARRDRRERERLGQPPKGLWEPVAARKAVRVSLTPDDAYARVVDALREVDKARVISSDPRRRRVVAKVGMTRASWGERLAAEVGEVPSGTVVKIESTPSFRFTVLDRGKNLANVDRVLHGLASVIEHDVEASGPSVSRSAARRKAPPRRAPARAQVVLYESAGQWRFAYSTARGDIAEERIGHGEVGASEAQQAVEKRLRKKHGVEIRGEWHSDTDGWWTAEIAPVRRS